MKCNYNGCSSKCKGDIDVDSCNVLRAYNQGRADQKKADNEFFNFEGAWELARQEFAEPQKTGVQIKVDAVKEFIKALEKNQTHQDNYLDPPRFEMSVDFEDIQKIAGQLINKWQKEKKNE